MSKSYLKLGDWNAICDVCGFEFKASKLRKRWDNLMVCKADFEHRHPMDFFKGHSDKQSVPWSRSEGSDAAGVDIEGNSTDFLGNTIEVGDVNKTLTVGTDPNVQVWNTTLTESRTCSLATPQATENSRFIISKTVDSDYPLYIGGRDGFPALLGSEVGTWLADTTAEVVTGVERVTDTGMSSAANWPVTGGTGAIVSGELEITHGGSGSCIASQVVTGLIIGESYILEGEAYRGTTINDVYIDIQGIFGAPVTVETSKDYLHYTFTATSTSHTVQLYISGADTAGRTAYFDNVRVREADNDLSTNDHDLAYYGSITKSAVATGSTVMAYSGFSASNYLQQSYDSALDFGTGDFSIMGWLQADSANGSLREYILERSSSGGGATSIAVIREYTGKFQFSIGSGLTTTSSTSYINGNYHFAMVRKAGVGYIYINGVLDGTAALAGSVTDTDATTKIGVDWAINASGWHSYDPIALLRISATAPTAAQINTIYDRERAHFQEGGSPLLQTIPANVKAVATVEYNGSAWFLVDYTPLGL